MRFWTILAVCILWQSAAQAQLLDQLKGGAGGLGGGGIPSVGSASTGNVAGLLSYCIRNKYLGGGSTSSVQSGLMGKLTGGSKDSGYQAGNSGMLQTGSGQGFNLGGGGGLKDQLTQKICDEVLQRGKSLL